MRVLFILQLVLISWVSAAQEPLSDSSFYIKSKRGMFTIHMDQDFFYVTPSSKNEDRNYTQGTAFSYSNPKLIETFLFYPLHKIEYWLRDMERYSSTISLGGTAFTPRVIDTEDPVIGDRPFAFLLYISTASVFKDNREGVGRQNVYHSFKLNYGLYGTRIGYAVQSFLHKNVVKGRPVDPKGWEHQISDGGGLAMLLEYERFQSLTRTRRLWDVGFSGGASVGYYDRFFGSAFFRFGKIKSENQAKWNWVLGATSSANLEKVEFDDEKLRKSREVELFLFGKITPSLMFRNASLVGQGITHSDYTIDGKWANLACADFEWGVVYGIEYIKKNELRQVGLILRQVIRSPEFNSGLYPERWHFFGSIAVQFPL